MNQEQKVVEVEVPEQEELDLEPQEELEQQAGLGTFGLGRLKNLSLDF